MGGTALDEQRRQDGRLVARRRSRRLGLTPKSDRVRTSGRRDGRPRRRDGERRATVRAPRKTDLKAASTIRRFHSAAASIRQAWQAMPDITEIADNLLVEETEEGLNIQIIDQEGRPMFPEGSKYPYRADARRPSPPSRRSCSSCPTRSRISGHTAAGGTYANPRYGAWELSSDRANVVRAILGEFGLADDHIQSVVGRADQRAAAPQRPLSGGQRAHRDHAALQGAAGAAGHVAATPIDSPVLTGEVTVIAASSAAALPTDGGSLYAVAMMPIETIISNSARLFRQGLFRRGGWIGIGTAIARHKSRRSRACARRLRRYR